MLRKTNRKAKKRFFTLILLFVFFISSQGLILSRPVSASVEEGNPSVEWGDNIYQNLPYNYSQSFYDNTDPTDAWDTAKIEFTYIPDTTINDEYIITDSFDNNEIQYPTNSSFSMVNGTHYQNGTLNSLDNNYHVFNSTTSEVFVPEQSNNFTLLNGTSDFDGNIKYLDSNYTTFYSEESGHYPATYSFTNETGLVGSNIPFVDWGTDLSMITVSAEHYGHKEVLKHAVPSANWYVRSIFDSGNQMSGSLEYWQIVQDASTVCEMRLEDNNINNVQIKVDSDTIWYVSGGAWHDSGETVYDNTWFHTRIDWRNEATDKFDVYLDGVLILNNINFQTNMINGMDSLMFYHINQDVYYDAFGYSWDSEYLLGDNAYWDWYKDQDSDFESNNVGDNPTGWSIDETAGIVDIFPSFDYHKKVVKITDTNNGANTKLYKSISQTSGIVEFWIKNAQVNQIQYFTLYEGVSVKLQMYWSNDGNVYYWNGASTNIGSYSANVWQHLYISFDCNTDKFTIYIDNVLKADDQSFNGVATTIDKIEWLTSTGSDNLITYIDAISFNWTSGNEIGDNQLPNNPLSLNFTVNMNLNNFSDLNDLRLVYSYKTNIQQVINFSIYNFNNLEYDNIEYSINESFNNCYFELNSSYYNATKDMILKFEMVNSSFTEFQFLLEMLKIRHSSHLNFTTHATFSYLSNLLQLDVKSYQRSNISQLIIISAWNYSSESWNDLDSESFYASFQLSEYTNNASFSSFINNDGKILLNYYGINETDDFRFEIDALNITLYRKTTFRYEHTLRLLGTWKYRFLLDVGLSSNHTTDWIYFNVVEQPANFEGISESRYSTRWVLTSTATTGGLTEVYYDDLTSGYWDLSDFSSRTFTKQVAPDHDSYVSSSNPTFNYGSDSDIWVCELTNTRIIYLGFPSLNYLYENSSNTDSQIYLEHRVHWDPSTSGLFYQTGSFDESTITYNDKPSDVSLLNTLDLAQGGNWYSLNTHIPYQYYSIHSDNQGSGEGYYQFYSYEWGARYPQLKATINKNYHTTSGEGYVYMQTSSTEALGLISSQSSSNTSLSEGDVFTVDLQSTSDNALLKLYSGGVLQQSINLLTANTETSRQEVEVIVSEGVSFDQIKITSELSDTESFKLYDIKAEHWVFENEEDQKIMYVEPYGQNELILNLGNNSLKIYENDILRTDTYITMTYDLTTHVFESPIPETVFVSFYDSNNDYLDFNIFTTYINYTLFEENFINQRLTSREFYVDEDSTIYFNVYDSFEVNIYSASRLAKTFIDITLSVYTLKIKNEALDDSSYTLTKGSVSKTGILFPDEIDEYKIASGSYTFAYIKGTDPEESIDFTLSGDKLLKINRSQMCFLSYTNQRGEYLNFNQFKTYWNGTLLYENVFYEDIGNNVSIEIKDHYEISVKNHSFIVSSGDNYIPVILTMYSLKVFNQQEVFNHINITRDPNYYESGYSWSEWVAPTEIIEFTLFAGYYKINLTDNENSGSSYYSYTLNGDDILLISSGNIISNVIINIANVNATLGNQITNVQIDLTNQNSEINNSIINIDINISNLNSSLGNLLVDLDLGITNVANNISSLYVFTNNSFINLDNNINNSFIYMENNIISINQSISNLVIGISNDIYLINGTISTMITQMENNLLLMNVSIDTALFDLATTVEQIGNNITNNYILLNNSITLTNNNINDSRIAIINNLALINNTISNLISQVYSSVYMINNSIYTAVIDMGTSLSLINNSISGDLTIMLQQNDFLTELYQTTMFSDLLNWTNIGYNSNLIDSQIDVWEFINNYKNQSIEVHLRYQDIIDNLTITAQNSILQYLPKDNTDYNLWSVEDQEYLDDWKPLPENRTVDFGFYEEKVPIDPNPFFMDFVNFSIFVMVLGVIGLLGLFFYFRIRYQQDKLNPRTYKKKRKVGQGTYNDGDVL